MNRLLAFLAALMFAAVIMPLSKSHPRDTA